MGKWLVRIALAPILLAAFLLFSFVIFWIWAMSGHVEGVEFSPDGFQLRHFSYTKPVLAKSGFWKEEWIDSDFSAELANLGVIPIRAPKTWHLAQDNVTPIRSVDRQAEVLTNLLQVRNADLDLFWISWSKKHPQVAARLWPLLQVLAFDQLYLITPLVFQAALEHQNLDAELFEKELRQVICTELESMKQEYQYQGNSKLEEQTDAMLQKYQYDQGPLPPPPQLNDKKVEDSTAAEAE